MNTKIQIEETSDEIAIEETEQYLNRVAIAMGIDDLQISHEIDGKYVNFNWKVKKQHY